MSNNPLSGISSFFTFAGLNITKVIGWLFTFGWLASGLMAFKFDSFVVSPAKYTTLLGQIEISVYTVGSILLAIGPVLLALDLLLAEGKLFKFLPFVALVHPASILIIKIISKVQEGNWYLSYLVNKPFYLLTDVLIPVLLFVLYLAVKNSDIFDYEYYEDYEEEEEEEEVSAE
jgi:hypothetical protein